MNNQPSVNDVLAKIRDEVEHEGHGASHVFVIFGASVSKLEYFFNYIYFYLISDFIKCTLIFISILIYYEKDKHHDMFKI